MYQSPDLSVWKGRTDYPDGEEGWRWHHIVQSLDLFGILPNVNNEGKHFAFLGFCSDEGVRRNQGRVGAREGPHSIRKNLRNLAVHFDPKQISLFDAGDVICVDDKLELAQEMLGKKVTQLLHAGYKPIVLGGGHEVSFGHFQGIFNYNKQKNARIGIVNLDAHFDLRKYDRLGNSGTPFLQISELLKSSGQEFQYLALGIHEAANTNALFNTAKNLGAQWQTSSACTPNNLGSIFTHIEDFVSHVQGVYLSLDLDVINQAFAPGVSAPAPFGLQPEVVRQILKKIFETETVISLDIAELNPLLDIDSRTGQLAAHLIYYIINYWSVNSSSKQYFA
jgi:formiminoglutamase